MTELINIIQIVSDTFRWDYLGCYGNEWIHTENIDRFAKDAIVFDKAYIASWPTIPHRRDLFTGKYNFIESKWSFYGREPNLPWDEVILSDCLRKAGYLTMLIADTPHLVRDRHGFDRGFDGWLWIRGQENDRYMTHPIAASKEKQEALSQQYLRNISQRRFESDYFVAQTMQESQKWLEINYKEHEKFFMHVDTFDPHEPWDPPKWYVDMYAPDWEGETIPGMSYSEGRKTIAENLSDDELKQLRALYAGKVTLVDRWIGRFLQKIEDLGLFENTIIVFTSDHGTYLGEHNSIGKTPVLYEEISHIPLIVRMPDSMECIKGRCNALVQPPDLMPTYLEIAKTEIPDTVQGKSLFPIIQGTKKTVRESAISSGSLLETHFITITDGDLALIMISNDLEDSDAKMTVAFDFVQHGLYRKKIIAPTIDELYDLKSDPNQVLNIIDEKREIADALREEVIHTLTALGTSEKLLSRWKEMQ
jgi:arylsulfatase A-like enzyme